MVSNQRITTNVMHFFSFHNFLVFHIVIYACTCHCKMTDEFNTVRNMVQGFKKSQKIEILMKEQSSSNTYCNYRWVS